MADLTAIRAGLAANLATLTDIQVSPYMLSNPTPPTVHLYPSDIEYDLAFRRGLDKWSFTVQAFVGLASEVGAQKRLDAYLAASGSQSVKAALESDKTLGGLASSVQVTACTGYRVYDRSGNAQVLGAEWTVELLATGS